jgi:hypothetical protein
VTTLVFVPGIALPVVSPLEGGTNRVQAVAPSSWTLLQSVVVQNVSAWNIPFAGVTTTIASSFNTTQRISVKSSYRYTGLCAPVVQPIDYKQPLIPGSAWNIDQRILAQTKSTYKINKRLSVSKQSLFNIYVQETSRNAAAFRVLKRIFKPGVPLDTHLELMSVVVHPITYKTSIPTPASEWNMAQRMTIGKAIRFNVLGKRTITQRSTFNAKALAVTATKAVAWNTVQRGDKLSASSWALAGRTHTRKASSFNLRKAVVAQQSSHFRDLGKVTKTIASSWKAESRLKKYSRSEWVTQIHRITRIKSAFNTNHSVVIQKSIHFRSGINPITVTKASAWNVYTPVTVRKASAWHMNSRIAATTRAQFHTLISGSTTAIIEWNIGAASQADIRQTVIDRTDFQT